MSIETRNNVVVKGSGARTIMFAHGFGCDQNMWRFVTPAFEKDYRVVLFDYVGCGKSDASAYHPERYASLQGYAQDVIDVCETLDLKEVIFIGHSVSSMIGLLAAVEKPRLFADLIFIGPSPHYINEDGYEGGFSKQDLDGLFEVMDQNYLGWANFLAPVVMKNPDQPLLVKELEESFCSTDPRIARKFAEVTFFGDNRADLAKLHKPCLILQCSDDSIAPATVGAYLHQHLEGSVLETMTATGHCPHMSHPEETIALIRKYLNRAV